MNYQRIYDNLINRSYTRTLDDYTEVHHIIPKCMGGSDDKSNLAILTPEEHYVAHQILVKIYPKHKGLIHACKMMSMKTHGKRNNKLYGWIRRKCTKYLSELNNERHAVRRGFDSYEHQLQCIWNAYVVDKFTIGEVIQMYNTNDQLIRKCLNVYANLHDKCTELKEARFYHKSNASTATRNNFTEEQELRRLKATNKAAKTRKKDKRDGSLNPSAKAVIIDGVEYGCIKDAAIAHNIEYHTCHNRLKSNNWPTWIRK